jgi:hypothetical protein
MRDESWPSVTFWISLISVFILWGSRPWLLPLSSLSPWITFSSPDEEWWKEEWKFILERDWDGIVWMKGVETKRNMEVVKTAWMKRVLITCLGVRPPLSSHLIPWLLTCHRVFDHSHFSRLLNHLDFFPLLFLHICSDTYVIAIIILRRKWSFCN